MDNIKLIFIWEVKLKCSVTTKKEQEICKKITKPFLLENKLIFVGIDLIDEKLSEINVTSPTGMTNWVISWSVRSYRACSS